jgi:uncharacterized protein YneF (UPF0154 family)
MQWIAGASLVILGVLVNLLSFLFIGLHTDMKTMTASFI